MAFDLNYDGVVQQAVQQGCGDDVVAEDGSPLLEAAIGGEYGGALLVAGVDQLEEQVGAVGFDGQVADLIDDEQGSPVDVAQARGEGRGALGLDQDGDEFGQGGEVDTLAGLDRVHAEGDGEVALADAILDRLIHNAHRLTLEGESMRKKQGFIDAS